MDFQQGHCRHPYGGVIAVDLGERSELLFRVGWGVANGRQKIGRKREKSFNGKAPGHILDMPIAVPGA